ncbi:MAG: prenyltransferase/squalene oxidase repeat-containing protein [Phycisphaerae bacterium]
MGVKLSDLRLLWWLRQRPAGHARLLWRDLRGDGDRHHGARPCLEAAIDWLCLAQDQTGGGGVAGFYDLLKGWSPPYPETTGYIVPTFLQAAKHLGREDLRDRARRMLDWLLTTQMRNGAFPAGLPRGDQPREPRIFNTGQIIQGLVAGYREFGAAGYLDAAVAAGEWLCCVQDSDGAWRTASYHGVPHAYHSRVDWPLVELGQEVGRSAFIDAARRNLDWILAQRRQDGWFDQMEMTPGQPPALHPIEYTLSGVWESGELLDDETYRSAVFPAVEILAEHAIAGRLAGAYGPGFKPAGKSICLTGYAQMAFLWLRIHQRTGLRRLQQAAEGALGVLERLADLENPERALRGGVRGSYPLTGEYMPLSVVNWGAKFFIDALLLEQSGEMPGGGHEGREVGSFVPEPAMV